MTQTSHHNFQNWVLLALLTLIWGSSYILIKKGLVSFTAVELALLRISISGICSLPVAFMVFRNYTGRKLALLLLLGVLSTGLPAFLFATSMTKSDSAVNGILNALSPLWTVVLGYYFFKTTISKNKIFGVLIGFLGAVGLVLGQKDFHFQMNSLYAFLPVIATFCYGMSTNITKQKLQFDNPIHTTAIAMSLIGIPAVIGCLNTDAPAKILSGQVWMSFSCIVILATLSTLVAWILFYRLIQRTDALFGASVTYIVPVVAILWGTLDGEVLSGWQLLGMMLILAGVYFTTGQAKVKAA